MIEMIGTIMMIIIAIPLAFMGIGLAISAVWVLVIVITSPVWMPVWALNKLMEWWEARGND